MDEELIKRLASKPEELIKLLGSIAEELGSKIAEERQGLSPELQKLVDKVLDGSKSIEELIAEYEKNK